MINTLIKLTGLLISLWAALLFVLQILFWLDKAYWIEFPVTSICSPHENVWAVYPGGAKEEGVANPHSFIPALDCGPPATRWKGVVKILEWVSLPLMAFLVGVCLILWATAAESAHEAKSRGNQ